MASAAVMDRLRAAVVVATPASTTTTSTTVTQSLEFIAQLLAADPKLCGLVDAALAAVEGPPEGTQHQHPLLEKRTGGSNNGERSTWLCARKSIAAGTAVGVILGELKPVVCQARSANKLTLFNFSFRPPAEAGRPWGRVAWELMEDRFTFKRDCSLAVTAEEANAEVRWMGPLGIVYATKSVAHGSPVVLGRDAGIKSVSPPPPSQPAAMTVAGDDDDDDVAMAEADDGGDASPSAVSGERKSSSNKRGRGRGRAAPADGEKNDADAHEEEDEAGDDDGDGEEEEEEQEQEQHDTDDDAGAVAESGHVFKQKNVSVMLPPVDVVVVRAGRRAAPATTAMLASTDKVILRGRLYVLRVRNVEGAPFVMHGIRLLAQDGADASSLSSGGAIIKLATLPYVARQAGYKVFKKSQNWGACIRLADAAIPSEGTPVTPYLERHGLARLSKRWHKFGLTFSVAAECLDAYHWPMQQHPSQPGEPVLLPGGGGGATDASSPQQKRMVQLLAKALGSVCGADPAVVARLDLTSGAGVQMVEALESVVNLSSFTEPAAVQQLVRSMLEKAVVACGN